MRVLWTAELVTDGGSHVVGIFWTGGRTFAVAGMEVVV